MPTFAATMPRRSLESGPLRKRSQMNLEFHGHGSEKTASYENRRFGLTLNLLLNENFPAWAENFSCRAFLCVPKTTIIYENRSFRFLEIMGGWVVVDQCARTLWHLEDGEVRVLHGNYADYRRNCRLFQRFTSTAAKIMAGAWLPSAMELFPAVVKPRPFCLAYN